MTNRAEIADLIAARIKTASATLQAQYAGSGAVPTFILDDLLPERLARDIHARFPSPEDMQLKSTLRERKYVSAQMDAHDPLIEETVFAFQDPRVVAAVATATGLRALEPDSQLYAGGISAMTGGHFLEPHLDNSHDADRRRYRVSNLLYYVTPDWSQADGGALELWDKGRHQAPRRIASTFNRLVVMATNRRSWHSVERVAESAPARCCVSNYYFSVVSPEACEYRHATSFRARPGQPLRGLALTMDAAVRTAAMKVLGDRKSSSGHRYQRPN